MFPAKSDASDGRARAVLQDLRRNLQALGRERASSADPGESDHDKSAGREPDSPGGSAFLAGGLPERRRPAGGLISRLDRRAAEQPGGRQAVRQDSVWQEAAVGCRHPWEIRARRSPTEERPDGAWDAERACWAQSRNWPAPVLPGPPEAGARRIHAKKPPATAGADRKESDLAWGPAVRDGLESEYREARRVFPQRAQPARKRAADARARIEEVEEEQAPPELRELRVVQSPLRVRAWEPTARAMASRELRLRAPGRLPFPSKRSGATHWIPLSAGA